MRRHTVIIQSAVDIRRKSNDFDSFSSSCLLHCYLTWKSFWASGTLFLSCLAELLKARLARTGTFWKHEQMGISVWKMATAQRKGRSLKTQKKTWRKSLPQCFSPACSGDLFFVFAVIPQMISNTGAYTTADKCLVSCLQDNKCSSPLASLSLNVPTRFHVCFPVKADVQVKVTIL